MTVLELSRWQFAFTVLFHMTFPAITVGMAVFLAAVYGVHFRTGSALYLQIFRFWKRIFAVAYGLGVVAGTTMTFEFGLDWGRFAASTGPVIAPIIGMEVVTAFFVEAGFIGIMLFGDGRARKGVVFLACCLVALGTILSTTWIMAANSWLQVPVGFAKQAGQFVPENWWTIILNPAFVWRFPHMLLGVLVAASLFIAGIAAYYLLRGRSPAFARRTFSIAVGALAVVIPLQLAVGDSVAFDVVARYQMPKLEAMNGNWDSTSTGFGVFVIPDAAEGRNLVSVQIPVLGSLLGKDLTGRTPAPGLLRTPAAERPDMWTTFYGFRTMFITAGYIFLLAMIGVVLRLRRRLFTTGWYHKLMLWSTPAGIVAILAGWILAETGRQPWVVYGQLATADSVSALAPAELILSVTGFMCVYAGLLAVFVVYTVHAVRRGPEGDDPTGAERAPVREEREAPELEPA